MRWVGPILLLIGGLMLWRGFSQDQTVSFDDGSFLWNLMLLFGGAIMIVVGILALILMSLWTRPPHDIP